jgi:acyl carrier protein
MVVWAWATRFVITTQQGDPVDQELFARFKKCAVEVLSVDESAVVPDAKFGDDLDADSLDLVELVMALEEEFGVEVPEEELDGVETVGQAYDLVVGKL